MFYFIVHRFLTKKILIDLTNILITFFKTTVCTQNIVGFIRVPKKSFTVITVDKTVSNDIKSQQFFKYTLL